jgi:hypothetical protein
MYRTPPMKPDVSNTFSDIFIILVSYYAPYTRLYYDRSSHAPIQVAVNVFVFAHSPIKLYGSRPILNYGLLCPRCPPGSTVFDSDH